jgi:hypothetical protein
MAAQAARQAVATAMAVLDIGPMGLRCATSSCTTVASTNGARKFRRVPRVDFIGRGGIDVIAQRHDHRSLVKDIPPFGYAARGPGGMPEFFAAGNGWVGRVRQGKAMQGNSQRSLAHGVIGAHW